jgi:hypothetical protein
MRSSMAGVIRPEVSVAASAAAAWQQRDISESRSALRTATRDSGSIERHRLVSAVSIIFEMPDHIQPWRIFDAWCAIAFDLH